MSALDNENLTDEERINKKDELLNHYAVQSERVHTLQQLLKAYTRYKKPLSELAGAMKVYPQVLINAKVSNAVKDKWNENKEVAQAAAEAEKKIGGTGVPLLSQCAKPLIGHAGRIHRLPSFRSRRGITS